jgi:glycosyltransferase involved in cell wall biosynthesis
MDIKRKTIYYWSPALSKVATCKAVINSVYSFNKYSKDFTSYLINACGEWNYYKKEIEEKKINLFKLNINYFKFLLKEGYIFSRISYLLIFLLSFFNLFRLIKKNKPDYLIAHLITSLPLVLFLFFKFETKLILRISGLPKLNIFRKILWKLSNNFLYGITCPTEETRKALIEQGIFSAEKIHLVRDPIIEISQIRNQQKEKIKEVYKEGFILAVGRLTKQKNQILLINLIKNIVKENSDIKLLILGDGESKSFLTNKIKEAKIENNVELLGYKKNIFKYLKKCKCFISTSLWEDPGFVMVEAAASNCFVISSDCRSGPKEFIGKYNGLLFKNNDLDDLTKTYNQFSLMSIEDVNKRIINAKKQSKNYTVFSHYKQLLRVF